MVSPIRPLFRRNGIEIALITVELWSDRLVVRLAGLPGETADAQQRRHEVEFDHWREQLVGAGKEAAGDPPTDPGARLLAPLLVEADDDAGTRYRLRSSASGGSGSEWHGDWLFVADVPVSIRRLTVRISSPEGDAVTVEVDLDESRS